MMNNGSSGSGPENKSENPTGTGAFKKCNLHLDLVKIQSNNLCTSQNTGEKSTMCAQSPPFTEISKNPVIEFEDTNQLMCQTERQIGTHRQSDALLPQKKTTSNNMT